MLTVLFEHALEEENMNYIDRLKQMADLVACPEDTIIECYNTLLTEAEEKQSYETCILMLELWDKHYAPLMEKLRSMGVLKKSTYQEI